MLRKQINFVIDDIISIKPDYHIDGHWKYRHLIVEFKNLICKNGEEYKYLCEIYDNLTTNIKRLMIRTSFIHGKIDTFDYEKEKILTISCCIETKDIEYIDDILIAHPIPRIISKTI